MRFEKAQYIPVIAAIVIAAAIFFFGFGVLNLFWVFDSKNPLLPGLYDYHAATWGDGLFLPIGAGALTYYVARNARLISKSARIAASAAVFVGAAVGALVQWSWLADESIAVNWTIPQPNVFAPSGWYHAIFFACALAFFAGAFVLFLVVRCRKSDRFLGSVEWIAEVLVWASAFGYLAMHLLDDYLADSSVARLSFLLLTLGFVATVLVCLAITSGSFVSSVCRMVPGLLLGVGLLAYFGSSSLAPAAELAYLLAIAALLCASFVPSAREGRCVVARFFSVAVGAVGVSLVVICAIEAGSADENAFLWYVVLAFATVLFVVSSAASNLLFASDRRMTGVGVGIAVAAVVYAVASNLSFEPQGVVMVAMWDFSITKDVSLFDYLKEELLFVALVALCVVQVKRFVLIVLKAAEDGGGSQAKRGAIVRRLQGVFYFQIVLVIGGMLVFMTLSKLSLTLLDMGSWAVGLPAVGPFGMLAAVSLLIVICFLLWVSSRFWFPFRFARVLTCVLSCLAYVILVVVVGGMRMPLVADWWSLWALFVCIGAPLFVGESFLSNCVMLRGKPPKLSDVVLTVLVFLGCLAVSIGAVLPTAGAGEAFHPTILSPGMSIVGILLSYVVIPFVCAIGYVSDCIASSKSLLLNNASSGVLQNGVAASAIIVFLGVFPLEVYLANAVAFAALLAIVFLMVTKLPKICFPLEANVAFLGKRAREAREMGLGGDMETLGELRSLSLHLQRQAVLTSAALIPWTIVMVCAYAIRNQAVSKLRSCAGEILDKAWTGLLLRSLSKDTFLLFADLLPIARIKYLSESSESCGSYTYLELR